MTPSRLLYHSPHVARETTHGTPTAHAPDPRAPRHREGQGAPKPFWQSAPHHSTLRSGCWVVGLQYIPQGPSRPTARPTAPTHDPRASERPKPNHERPAPTKNYAHGDLVLQYRSRPMCRGSLFCIIILRPASQCRAWITRGDRSGAACGKALRDLFSTAHTPMRERLGFV